MPDTESKNVFTDEDVRDLIEYVRLCREAAIFLDGHFPVRRLLDQLKSVPEMDVSLGFAGVDQA